MPTTRENKKEGGKRVTDRMNEDERTNKPLENYIHTNSYTYFHERKTARIYYYYHS